MGDVISFKTGRNQMVQAAARKEEEDLSAQIRLADWLRSLADAIEADAPHVEPMAAVVVLTGRKANEVLNVGYDNEGLCFEQACRAPLRRYAVRSTDTHIFDVI